MNKKIIAAIGSLSLAGILAAGFSRNVPLSTSGVVLKEEEIAAEGFSGANKEAATKYLVLNVLAGEHQTPYTINIQPSASRPVELLKYLVGERTVDENHQIQKEGSYVIFPVRESAFFSSPPYKSPIDRRVTLSADDLMVVTTDKDAELFSKSGIRYDPVSLLRQARKEADRKYSCRSLFR